MIKEDLLFEIWNFVEFFPNSVILFSLAIKISLDSSPGFAAFLKNSILNYKEMKKSSKKNTSKIMQSLTQFQSFERYDI